MELKEVMSTLKQMGSEQSKKVLKKHGALEPFYGVKITEMKKSLVKKIKKNYQLSIQLYETGNADAMYLAGLISEPDKMTKEQIQHWVKNAYWYLLSEYTVAWVAAESNYGWELALEWIDNNEEQIAAAGWATLSSLVITRKDGELNISKLQELLERVGTEIHTSKNRVRYTMNGFIIAVGSGIISLNESALKTANSIGKVNVEMGGTSCKVPFAPEYIRKVEEKGRLGVKKKRAIC